MTILFAILLGILYPLAMTGIGQAIFPRQANVRYRGAPRPLARRAAPSQGAGDAAEGDPYGRRDDRSRSRSPCHCRDGVDLHLTRKEHDVLAILARHIGRVVTHDRIIAAAWGGDDDPRVEYLRIVIRNLRQKLEFPGPVGSVIANELGVGYRLRSDT